MSPRSLPEFPSFEHLRKQSKRLCRAVQLGDPAALAQVVELHPRGQQVATHSWRDCTRPAEPLSHRFLRCACLIYGNWRPEHALRARQMLIEHPELASAEVFTAAACGDAKALERLLAATPGAVDRRGGPHDWPPLLYACYSRLDSPDPAHSSLAVVELLLAHGADPNAGFLWHGNMPPFTALTGAFGEGEDGNNQPPHRQALDLARRLLAAGADPNDGQTLYNRHFRAADDHLELLLAHGAPFDLRGRDGRTPHETALQAGNREIAELLRRHGARAQPRTALATFAAACAAGDDDAARSQLAEDATLLQQLGSLERTDLLHHAVAAHRPAAIRLMASLGFDLDAQTHNTPLHQAAWSGDLESLRVLLELGADPTVRDPKYDATPLVWAVHNRQTEAVAMLVSRADVFDALQCGALDRVAKLLQRDPALAHSRDHRGRPLACLLRGDLPLDAAVALLRTHGVDLGARDGDGRTVLDLAAQRDDTGFLAQLRRLGVGD